MGLARAGPGFIFGLAHGLGPRAGGVSQQKDSKICPKKRLNCLKKIEVTNNYTFLQKIFRIFAHFGWIFCTPGPPPWPGPGRAQPWIPEPAQPAGRAQPAPTLKPDAYGDACKSSFTLRIYEETTTSLPMSIHSDDS